MTNLAPFCSTSATPFSTGPDRHRERHGLRHPPIFERAGCLSGIGSFVLSYEHGVAKPPPALFLTACAELGVMPGETLMVGDSPATWSHAALAARCAVRMSLVPPL